MLLVFCSVAKLSDGIKILEFNQYKKSDKTPFIFYADPISLVEKTDGCKNNPEKSSATKVGKHFPSGFSMFAILSFKEIENKYGGYRGKDCMRKFCESLPEHVMKIINFRKKQWSY